MLCAVRTVQPGIHVWQDWRLRRLVRRQAESAGEDGQGRHVQQREEDGPVQGTR